MKSTRFKCGAVLWAVIAITAFAGGQPAVQSSVPAVMTNADVIALSKAGLGDEIVIAKIDAAPATAFDTSINGLKALKVAGVSIEIVKTMISPKPARAAVTAADIRESDDPKSPHSEGIYVMSDSADGQSHMTKMRVVEPIQIALNAFSHKAVVELGDQHAALQIADPTPKFYAYAGEDTATFESLAGRLALVKLDSEVDRKGRKLVLGSHSSGAKLADKVRLDLTVVEIRDGVLMMTPTKQLAPGEYAFYKSESWQQQSFDHEGGQYFDFGLKAKP